MNKTITLGVVCIIIIALLGYAVWLLVKEFQERIKANRIFSATIFVIIVALFATYFTALFCKSLKLWGIVEQVGSADAWIGFSGSCLGGVITMLALYFTLKDNRENSRQDQINSIRPYLSCRIVNTDEEQQEILIKDYIDNYGFIECEMKNISANIANGIKIKEEFSLVETGNSQKRYDDLLEQFGISIYTVSMNDGTFLAPQEKYRWRTNFCVELNDDGGYKWSGAAFDFKHIICFEFTDISSLRVYTHRFEFEININVDVENNLHFFLWNISNSLNDSNSEML